MTDRDQRPRHNPHAWPVIIEDEVTGQSDDPVIEALAVVLTREELPAQGPALEVDHAAQPPALEHLWQRLGGRRIGGWQFCDRRVALGVRGTRRAAAGGDECLPIACGPAGAVVGMRAGGGGAIVLWPAGGQPPRTLSPALPIWLAELLAWTEHGVGDPIG
jgi:hypothetical protein